LRVTRLATRATSGSYRREVSATGLSPNALTQLSPDGTVCAFSRVGADLVVDVSGWLDPPA
jgi:hypothetical protein